MKRFSMKLLKSESRLNKLSYITNELKIGFGAFVMKKKTLRMSMVMVNLISRDFSTTRLEEPVCLELLLLMANFLTRARELNTPKTVAKLVANMIENGKIAVLNRSDM